MPCMTVLYTLYTDSMDALGLLSAVMSSSGMSILTAGASVSAPPGAQIAIVCFPPTTIDDNTSQLTYPSQVGMCSNGQIIRFTHPWKLTSGKWSWGGTYVEFTVDSSRMNVSISCAIYLG